MNIVQVWTEINDYKFDSLEKGEQYYSHCTVVLLYSITVTLKYTMEKNQHS